MSREIVQNAEATLSTFAATLTVDNLPSRVVTKVKELALDSIGVALAGSTAVGAEEIVGLIRTWGGAPESSVVGHALAVPAPLAALANGMMATARDYDDTLDDAMLHTQPSVLYAVLSMAEARAVSGRDLVAALTAGAEVLCRLGRARARGQEFLPTGTLGSIAAAAGTARALGLPADRLLNACGIAYSQAAGNVQPLREGATIKRFHAGFAAKVGVLSALLAERGITGAHRYLEGEFGYFQLYERGDYSPVPLTEALGESFHLLDLSFKPYPSARDNHGAVEAALQLTAFAQGQADDVDRVDVWLPPNAFGVSGHPLGSLGGNPIVEAIVSAQYCVAAALLRGHLRLDDLSEAAIMDPNVRALASRVRIHELTDHVDSKTFVPQRVRVTFQNGRHHEAEVGTLLGDPMRPLTSQQLRQKFRSCCALAAHPVSESTVRKLVDAIGSLETLPDAGVIGRLAALTSKEGSD